MNPAPQTAQPDALLCAETVALASALAGDGPLLIALSGGGDSVALLHLLCDALGPERLRAAVIDHALRAESAAEAQRAAACAMERGVAASIVTLTWSNQRPAQASARRKRYAALCDAARRCDARVILTGHTADDQAETVLMRAASGATWRGLAGMRAIASAPVWPEGRGIVLARPLLRASRSALRDDLNARGADWIEDPSNANAAFTRVRARAALAEAPSIGPRLTRFSATLRQRADAEDAEALALIRTHAQFERGEIAAPFAMFDSTAGARAFRALAAAAAGAETEPPESRADAIRTFFRPDSAATLGGALIRVRRGVATFTRDLGAIHGRADGEAPLAPLPLQPDQPEVWDGRVLIGVAQQAVALPGEGAEPQMEIEGLSYTLADAEAAGIASGEWLLAAHVARRLAPGEIGG